jgi:hypothetical protein
MRYPRELATAAHRVGNDLTIAHSKNVACKIFPEFGSFYEGKYALVPYQQGIWGVTHPWYCILTSFKFRSNRNTNDSGAILVGSRVKRI